MVGNKEGATLKVSRHTFRNVNARGGEILAAKHTSMATTYSQFCIYTRINSIEKDLCNEMLIGCSKEASYMIQNLNC